MFQLPPKTPPHPAPETTTTLPSTKQTIPNPNQPLPERSRKKLPLTLQHHRPRRTSPFVWFCAILFLILSLLLIFFGIVTLIIYLVIKPRNPIFDVPNANLNTVYFDSPEFFNGDLIFVANFTNPNRKIYVRFEYVNLELYFSDRLIGTQALEPFVQRRREARLVSVHMISSLVYLPQKLGVELQKQVQINKVIYDVRGSFKVRASLGLLHYSYWLHGRCEILMTGPPTGVLVARNCKTKR